MVSESENSFEKDQIKFDFDALFETEKYLYFNRDNLDGAVTDQQVDFLVRELSLAGGMNVLDLCCGYGRHANKLASMGMNVTGIDNNQGFLDIAIDDASKAGFKVEYLNRDMRKLNFKDRFDAALLIVNEIGYFSDDDNLKVVRRINKSLKSGGLFCFDCFNRDILMKNFLPYIIHEKEDNFMIDKNSFDPSSGRLNCERTYLYKGKEYKAPFTIRFYSLTEIQAMMKSAGFEISGTFGGWDSSEFKIDSVRMIIIARKAK